ncbi:hypothetical protein AGMMS50284_4280 [Clostridia bacterium]|nr:hypothetical protein AGMMS50284_4280 [Clostridia bacterium]
MAMLRMQRNGNFTIVSNIILGDKNLSLVTISTFMGILSLKGDWQHCITGLATQLQISEYLISKSLKELEAHDYLIRTRTRGKDGKWGETLYTFTEDPKSLPLSKQYQTAKGLGNAIIMRANKQKNFTIIYNKVLYSDKLSAHAKGLFIIISSLHDEWKFSVDGLCKHTTKSHHAISVALRELEKHGYLKRTRNRNEKGQLTDITYEFTEDPELLPLTPQQPKTAAETNLSTVGVSAADDENAENEVTSQIDYDTLTLQLKDEHQAVLDEIVTLMSDVYSLKDKYTRVSFKNIPTKVVKQRFKEINSQHVLHVIKTFKNTTKHISNVQNYINTMLFNAPTQNIPLGSVDELKKPNVSYDIEAYERYSIFDDEPD